MPTIVTASSKGGCAKSTITLTLATTLAGQGATVTVIDTDPNHPIADWRTGRSKNPLKVITATETNLLQAIKAEATTQQFVFVDNEGSSNRLLTMAISKADLVLVPVKPSPLDSREAGKSIDLIRQDEEIIGRTVPTRVVFSATNPAIKTRIEKEIIETMREYGVQLLNTHLSDRQAYKAQFLYRLALDELDPLRVNGVSEALRNATVLADEILDFFVSQQAAA